MLHGAGWTQSASKLSYTKQMPQSHGASCSFAALIVQAIRFISEQKTEAPGSVVGSRALEQPSPRTAHGANLGGLPFNIKET